MPIIGHGIDIVETSRIRASSTSTASASSTAASPRQEQAYCAKNRKRYYEHLAGRFAAKEAVLKVLGTGWRGGIAWTDIEILPNLAANPRSTSPANARASPPNLESRAGTSASATSKPTPPPAPSASAPKRLQN